MNLKIVISVLLIYFFILSCKTEERNFDEVKDLSKFPKTEFLPTLENNISDNKNAVYCATLPFAWNEILQETGKPTNINKNYIDLILLNNSKTYIDALNKDEYESSIEIEDETIKANVFFKKSLPFEFKLNSYDKKLIFDKTPVKSFGLSGYDEFEMINSVKIIYYKDDENFIIKLLPKDENHEIILFKTKEKFTSISEMNQEIEKLTDLADIQKQNNKLYWKFQFREEDKLIIPKINFNIKTNFPKLEGNLFSGFERQYKIESIIQRTAFILDESGAEIESKVEFAVEAAEKVIEEKPKPKQLIFDKPFLILLKRKDSTNPYFGLWNINAELMVK
ncbi:serpin family protein [uncultured Flavobacterium sp.]|uniref:serpin family protein n=1 Tax=uncultured Flavobacterium sp. TaxID=165435 RepID=UPI0030C89F8B